VQCKTKIKIAAGKIESLSKYINDKNHGTKRARKRPMKIIAISKQQMRRFMLTHQGLLLPNELKNQLDICGFIKRVGCIQFDPLNVVGRNPDLVLQARITGYRINDIETYLYENRELIDIWDKNMSICCTEDWPYFSRFRTAHQEWCVEYSDKIKKIRDYLSEHPWACSSDFTMEEKVGWHYGPQRFAKAALECMCYAGEAIVHHKKGNRRYYGLAERYLPREIFLRNDVNETIEEFYQWAMLRRINSIGALWNKASDAWLGVSGLKTNHRNAAFAALAEKNKITEIRVNCLNVPLYIATENQHLLEQNDIAVDDSNKIASILAPLDNLIWDRKLIGQLFDFEYKWEVYTPVAQRKYGYYVLPVLYGDRFVARFEPGQDKKTKMLIIKNWWWEPDVEQTAELHAALQNCFRKFLDYLELDAIHIDKKIQNRNQLAWLTKIR
jgi:hypothetical protein